MSKPTNPGPNSIVKVPKRRGYTVIPNGLLPEGKVSARAWGLYAYLLSRPPGWEVRTSQLGTVFSEGRDAIYTALKQLVSVGLMSLESYRNEEGLPRKRYVLIDPEQVLKSPNPDFQDTDYQGPEKPGVTTTNLTSPELRQERELVTTDTSARQKHPFTSDESDDQKETFTTGQGQPATKAKPNPGNLTPNQRANLRQAMQHTAEKMKREKRGFWDDDVQELWWVFIGLIEDYFPDSYDSQFCDLLENGKWSISTKEASPLQAGVQLNKLINTALGL